MPASLFCARDGVSGRPLGSAENLTHASEVAEGRPNGQHDAEDRDADDRPCGPSEVAEGRPNGQHDADDRPCGPSEVAEGQPPDTREAEGRLRESRVGEVRLAVSPVGGAETGEGRSNSNRRVAVERSCLDVQKAGEGQLELGHLREGGSLEEIKEQI